MVDLTRARVLGKGSSRLCYVHPDDERKCVKVVYTRRKEIIEEELKYYRQYERRGVSWDMLARSYGIVHTNMGDGAVFGLARDFDGEISLTLDRYLPVMRGSAFEGELRAALEVFRAYLFRERIVLRELKPDNVVYQRISPESGRLVLIDGVGNNQFLPIANYSRIFVRHLLKKKWAKFEQLLNT
ncbi:PhoP regulatory network protein YrbL [Chlorobium sp.]|jgi:hypothetical protein|uniref:PhoP regulatory network protein YrbL n=1 Tax=Chlorobium sp. TaxID=1095 RepID=UPI003C6A7CC2